MHLSCFDIGSLFYKSLAGGQDIELIRGLTGGHGYYGNYYPEWVSKKIEQKLHIIISNPKTQMSSNPLDYIKANQKAYDDIVKTGQSALTYMQTTQPDGMGLPCVDIILR